MIEEIKKIKLLLMKTQKKTNIYAILEKVMAKHLCQITEKQKEKPYIWPDLYSQSNQWGTELFSYKNKHAGKSLKIPTLPLLSSQVGIGLGLLGG